MSSICTFLLKVFTLISRNFNKNSFKEVLMKMIFGLSLVTVGQFINIGSQIASIVSLGLTVYLIWLSARIIRTLRRKTDTDSYNETRTELKDQLEADINMLRENELEPRLLYKIIVDIYEFNNYRNIFGKKIREVIDSALEEVNRTDGLDKGKLIGYLAQLKAVCNKKGEFYL